MKNLDHRTQVIKYLRSVVLDHWQHKWKNSKKGTLAETFQFFPDIPVKPRFKFSRESSQVLTGNRNFQFIFIELRKQNLMIVWYVQ